MDNPPRIVTHPLGLAGYALALVFALIGALGPSDKWPWLLPVAVTMAVMCVIGGLLLAKTKVGKPRTPSAASVIQMTSGDQSPAVNNTSGDVSINFGNPKKK
jgi:hypothetical protein